MSNPTNANEVRVLACQATGGHRYITGAADDIDGAFFAQFVCLRCGYEREGPDLMDHVKAAEEAADVRQDRSH
jgi:hypothetical protein